MRVVAGLFDDYDEARGAVSDLEAAGFPSEDMSIVANNAGERYTSGGAVPGATGLLMGLDLMVIPGIGPVVGAGWLASAAAGALTGECAGGIIETLTHSGLEEEDAHLYAEGVRRGSALVVVRADEKLVAQADGILRNRNAVDISFRRRAFTEDGWTRFDAASNPYSLDEVTRERERLSPPALL
ncbi:general stress protein [Sinorhizobium medicae]|uniref:general stress protein n=1 Tax=Sinorhizobium medicae TaxID=110321 RepID=UPI00036EE257|nr:general stress protein [Sinorhizobium medicae]